MKKAVPFIVLCSLLVSIMSLQVVAQDAGKKEFNTKKTEMNIAVANIFVKSNMWYPYYYYDGDYFPYAYDDYFRRPELVVGVKFHGDKGAFRLGTNLKYSNITNEDKTGSKEKYTFKNFGTTMNLGYEWHTTFNRVNIFYGFDVSTSYTSNYWEHEYSNSSGIHKNEITVKELAIGVNPLVGVNVFITPNLSVGTEVKFTAEHVSGKTESITTSNDSDTDKSESSGFRTRFGPIGFLSVNIHF